MLIVLSQRNVNYVSLLYPCHSITGVCLSVRPTENNCEKNLKNSKNLIMQKGRGQWAVITLVPKVS